MAISGKLLGIVSPYAAKRQVRDLKYVEKDLARYEADLHKSGVKPTSEAIDRAIESIDRSCRGYLTALDKKDLRKELERERF
jgi:hypothetical protein